MCLLKILQRVYFLPLQPWLDLFSSAIELCLRYLWAKLSRWDDIGSNEIPSGRLAAFPLNSHVHLCTASYQKLPAWVRVTIPPKPPNNPSPPPLYPEHWCCLMPLSLSLSFSLLNHCFHNIIWYIHSPALVCLLFLGNHWNNHLTLLNNWTVWGIFSKSSELLSKLWQKPVNYLYYHLHQPSGRTVRPIRRERRNRVGQQRERWGKVLEGEQWEKIEKVDINKDHA